MFSETVQLILIYPELSGGNYKLKYLWNTLAYLKLLCPLCYIYGHIRHKTRFDLNIKGRGHIYCQIMHKNNKTNKLPTLLYF